MGTCTSMWRWRPEVNIKVFFSFPHLVGLCCLRVTLPLSYKCHRALSVQRWSSANTASDLLLLLICSMLRSQSSDAVTGLVCPSLSSSSCLEVCPPPHRSRAYYRPCQIPAAVLCYVSVRLSTHLSSLSLLCSAPPPWLHHVDFQPRTPSVLYPLISRPWRF